MGLCGNRNRFAGGGICACKDKLWSKTFLMGIQPSEAIKITFVFFMAALLRKGADFSKVVQATVVAGLHVGILVLSRDLGSAVIFFAAYLVMIYVASRNVGYLALGLARRICRGSCRISSVWPCASESDSLEGSYGGISE